MLSSAAVVQADDRPVTALRGVGSSENPSPCETCSVRKESFCNVLIRSSVQKSPTLTQCHETAARRKMLFETEALGERVFAICNGWAFRFRRFEDGRRYILNFLIAGDFVFGAFSDYPAFSLQALTDIRFCEFARAEVKTRILEEPRAYDAWMEARIAEPAELAATAASLAHSNAAARIAQLILHLRDRLERRGMVHNKSVCFPVAPVAYRGCDRTDPRPCQSHDQRFSQGWRSCARRREAHF